MEAANLRMKKAAEKNGKTGYGQKQVANVGTDYDLGVTNFEPISYNE